MAEQMLSSTSPETVNKSGMERLPGKKVPRHIHKDPQKWVHSRCDVQHRVSRPQPCPEYAARERSRVRSLRQAFHSLQAALPSVPPNTKLSKLDVLVLATNYIAHLTQTLDQDSTQPDHQVTLTAQGYLHPVKKWPMRSLLYCGSMGELLTGVPANQKDVCAEEDAHLLSHNPGSRLV
ncbi:transcription factor 24 [Amia ocellicauda]|uniref:transcription factor 24 n=1 Tax=Amia ocellicauda TaxID=2972642 RepID=UPI00346430C0